MCFALGIECVAQSARYDLQTWALADRNMRDRNMREILAVATNELSFSCPSFSCPPVVGHIVRCIEALIRYAQSVAPTHAQTHLAWRSGHIHLSTFGRQQPTRRDIILTTNRQILPAVVLCVGVRRSDTPNAFVADSERRTGGAHRRAGGSPVSILETPPRRQHWSPIR